MNSSPLITVVIPTYNRASLLQQAIASVLQQTYTHWELIVADDGSTDHTAAIVRSVFDPRIRLIEIAHTGNIAAIRNAGANEGSGEWIAFLDSDDVWTPRKLEWQVSLLQQEKKQWAYGRFELMNDTGETIPAKAGTFIPVAGWIAPQLITSEVAVNIGSLIVSRRLFEETGGFCTDLKLLYREDYEFVLRLALRAEAAVVTELIVRVREHSGRSTHQKDDGNERTINVYRHFLHSNPEPALKRLAKQRMAHHLAELSVKSMRRRNYRSAARQWYQALANGDRARHLLSAFRRGFSAQNQ